MSLMSVQHPALPHDPAPLRIDESGTIRVGDTRVLLDLVVHAFQAGCPPEEIVDRYPSLNVADVYAAIGYYLRHQKELDLYLEERERVAEALRAEIEAASDPHLRDRLLARRNQRAIAVGE